MTQEAWMLRERRREAGFKASWFVVGAGAALVVLGLAVRESGPGAGAGEWAARLAGGPEPLAAGALIVGAMVVALGLFIALLRRPGEAARRLAETTPGRSEKAQAERAWLLTLIPLTMVFFASRAVGWVGRVLDGSAGLSDVLFLGAAILYAWLGPIVVMGWDGGSRRNRRYLEDELSQHIRARSIMLGFFVLLAGVTAALALALWNPVWTAQALPLAMSAAGAAAALRFVWLDRQAARDAED